MFLLFEKKVQKLQITVILKQDNEQRQNFRFETRSQNKLADEFYDENLGNLLILYKFLFNLFINPVLEREH